MKIEMTGIHGATIRQLIALSNIAQASSRVDIVITSNSYKDPSWGDWIRSIDELESDEYDNDWDTKTTTFRNGSTVRFIEKV